MTIEADLNTLVGTAERRAPSPVRVPSPVDVPGLRTWLIDRLRSSIRPAAVRRADPLPLDSGGGAVQLYRFQGVVAGVLVPWLATDTVGTPLPVGVTGIRYLGLACAG